MAAYVTTVLGPVPASSLGIVMMHEHLALALGPQQTVDDMEELAEELADLQSYGCRTVVELSNIGMGRDVSRLVTLARTSGMHIIAGTGFYVQNWHPEWVAHRSVDELAELMVKELEQGIEDSGVCAGVIGEIGTSQHAITPDEEKVFRAAARAHHRTGRPISTHTSLGSLPLEQLDLLAEEDVDPRYITVGHLDLADDYAAVLEVARRGAYVQLDTFGKTAYQSDEARVQRLLDLAAAGYERSLLVSVDISRNTYMKTHGGFGYDHFLRVIMPELRRRGLGDSTLENILVNNPRRFLEGRTND